MGDRRFDEALEGLETGAAAEDVHATPVGAAADDASHPTVGALRREFGEAILHHTVMAGDEHVVYVAPERNAEILRWLRDAPEQRYDLLLDVTCVDWGGGRPLEVVYELWSIPHRRQLRLKATLPLQALQIDSVQPLYPTADWLEREAYDMFGVHFRGHPDLRRILMPDNYAEGHPLRKDFPLRGRFSRAEQTRRALAMATEDYYTPEELAFGRVPTPPGWTREQVGTDAARPAAEAAADPHGTPPRPDAAEGWGKGTSGSAAPGSPAAPPGPGGAGS